MLDKNTSSAIEWIVKQGSLPEKDLTEWSCLISRSAHATSSNIVEFNLNGIRLTDSINPIYVLGYLSENSQESNNNKSLKVALVLTQKQKSFMGIKFNLLQPISHDHVDMMSILGAEHLNDTKSVSFLKKALKENIKGWCMLSARRLRCIEPLHKRLISPSYSRKSAYFKLRDGENNGLEMKNIIPKKLLKNIKRFERKIEKEHLSSLQLIAYSSKDDVNAGLSEFFKLESSGWKGKAGSAIQCDSQLESFYRDSWRSFANEGFAKIFVLNSGDRVIASGIAFQTKDEVILHKIAFDEELSEYGPGSILVKQIMQNVIDECLVKTICFNTNPPWLRRWHAQCYDLVALQIFNSSLKGSIIKNLFKLVDTLRAIKQNLNKKLKQKRQAKEK
ncbi:MAG: hypothetical protein COA86_19060 [Kangiella sp.]|nr:MAG: hypothetical protein COA86_19060 [Kangiella sp.]